TRKPPDSAKQRRKPLNQVIDAMAVPPTPEILRIMGRLTLNDFTGGKAGIEEAEIVSQMDQAGVDSLVVVATRSPGPDGCIVPSASIKELCDRYPGRFYGLIGVDVFEPENSLLETVRAIEVHGFKGIYAYPHRLKVPPNSPLYDPFYRMARELNVPMVM